jgi:hypothetical protein
MQAVCWRRLTRRLQVGCMHGVGPSTQAAPDLSAVSSKVFWFLLMIHHPKHSRFFVRPSFFCAPPQSLIIIHLVNVMITPSFQYREHHCHGRSSVSCQQPLKPTTRFIKIPPDSASSNAVYRQCLGAWICRPTHRYACTSLHTKRFSVNHTPRPAMKLQIALNTSVRISKQSVGSSSKRQRQKLVIHSAPDRSSLL